MRLRLPIRQHSCFALALALLVLIGGPLVAVADQPPANPSPRSIVIELPVTPDQIYEVLALDLDIWSVAPDGCSLDLCVSAAELEELRLRGYEPVVVDPDFYATWERQRAAMGRGSVDEWTEYRTMAQVDAFLLSLHAAYPDISAPITIGLSIEGRPINGLRISDNAATVEPQEPAIFVVGCHHAREWISVEVPLYLADQLLRNYATNPAIRRLVNAGEIWIVPVLNPDGYVYTWTTNRQWRKNRRNNGNGTYGVDLNRNYSYKWGGSGSSGTPGSETYRGTAPFSEPETAAVRDLFAARDFAAGLSYHSYGQKVMCPWGYTTAAPPNSAYLEGLVADMAAIINSHNPPQPYTSGRIGVHLYIADGIFEDWVYGVHGEPGVIVELRPVGSPGFVLPPEQILPTCVENFPAALYLIDEAFGLSLAGDLNCDGLVNFGDINPFVLALTNPGSYTTAFPDCNIMNGDINGDGLVDFGDINPFVRLLTGP
ncbi:MAG: M14 family zinc carboxypeptidase [Planctomycetota bacterium]